MNISSYPKVLALGHLYIRDIFADTPVVVEEKVDGSQFSFMRDGNNIHMRSKGAVVYPESAQNLFKAATETVMNIAGKLEDGYIYRGEVLHRPKHNTLTYGRVPTGNIVIFDIERGPNNHVTNPAEKYDMAEAIGLECVPAYRATVTCADDVKKYLDFDSFLGGCKIEGVVIKNYHKITPDGKFMVGKYVSESFKERNGANWKATNPSRSDVVQGIIDSLRTDARRNKAVQHLRDAGMLTGTPSDIGKLIKEMQGDIDAEELEYITQTLVQHFLPSIKRGVAAGMAKWYKDKLLQGVFE